MDVDKVMAQQVDTETHGSYDKLTRAVAISSVGVAIILIAIKFFAYLETESVSLLSSLIDSALDSAASLINMVAVMIALNPADDDHRFGHGKAEPIAGLGQAAFISGSVVFLIIESVNRLINLRAVDQVELGIGVMIISIVMTLGLVLFQRYVLSRRRSLAIQADSLHYTGDLLMNASVIAALVLTQYFDLPLADPLFALGIAIYVSMAIWKIVKGALDQLMDRELPETDRAEIIRIIEEYEPVRGFHEMRTRASGVDTFLQVHVELDPKLDLVTAHDIGVELENRLQKAFPSLDIIIHLDPDGIQEKVKAF